jgi:hypothetical protein
MGRTSIEEEEPLGLLFLEVADSAEVDDGECDAAAAGVDDDDS